MKTEGKTGMTIFKVSTLIVLFSISCNFFKLSIEQIASKIELIEYEYLDISIYSTDLVRLNNYLLTLYEGERCQLAMGEDYEIQGCLKSFCEEFDIDYSEIIELINFMNEQNIAELIVSGNKKYFQMHEGCAYLLPLDDVSNNIPELYWKSMMPDGTFMNRTKIDFRNSFDSDLNLYKVCNLQEHMWE